MAKEVTQKPYYEEQYHCGRFLIRKTRSKNDWMRYQAGKNVAQDWSTTVRDNKGHKYTYSGTEVVFWLKGCGETPEEAILMANGRGY